MIDRLNLRSTGDEDLQQACEAAIDRLKLEAESARNGNTRVLKRLVGEVMKRSQGRADAQAAAAMLRKLIGLPAEGGD